MKITEIQAGDSVTILRPAGLALRGGKAVQEWKEVTGRAVMPGSERDSWVLNLGGKYGTPGVATHDNFVRAKENKAARSKAAGWQNRRFP